MTGDYKDYERTHLAQSNFGRSWQGSPARDRFKWLHKNGRLSNGKRMSGMLVATDLDLLLVEKNPDGIVANLDVKVGDDSVTFSEVIAYNDLRKLGKQIFIVHAATEADLEGYRFTVSEYLGGNRGPNPPIVTLGPAFLINGFDEWSAWEIKLRMAWKKSESTGSAPSNGGH